MIDAIISTYIICMYSWFLFLKVNLELEGTECILYLVTAIQHIKSIHNIYIYLDPLRKLNGYVFIAGRIFCMTQ